MRPVDVKSNTCIDSSKEINDKDTKFKIGDIVRISLDIVRLKRFLYLKALKILRHGHMLSQWRRNCWNILRKQISSKMNSICLIIQQKQI